MRRAKVDAEGNVRCWRCGATGFTSKRTLKGKLGFGLLAPKRMKCMGCGTFNEHGSARQAKRSQRRPAQTPPAGQGPPAGWYGDPDGQPVQRWWDGTTWTEHTQPVLQP